MRCSYRILWYSTCFVLLFLRYSSTLGTLLYPLCKLPDGPLYANVWLLYFQEQTKSAIMLWQEDTHVLMRLTSARFNPKKVHCSPNGGIVSFLDDGILWLRRVSRRYTRALETAFPIGTIVDYIWYDMNHIIVCTRKGRGSSIYCVNLDGTVCGELSFTDTTILSVSCSSETSLLCVAREHNTYSGDRVIQIEIDATAHPIQLNAMRCVWSTGDLVLSCQHITSTTAYVVTTPGLSGPKNDHMVRGSLYYVSYADELPIVRFVTEIPLESAMALGNQEEFVQRYQEEMQSVMPASSPDGKSLAIPLIARCGTGCNSEMESRLMLFDGVHNTSHVCDQQGGIAFLSPQWASGGFFCGGAVVECEQRMYEGKKSPYACIMYYDDDRHKLLLPYIAYSGARESTGDADIAV